MNVIHICVFTIFSLLIVIFFKNTKSGFALPLSFLICLIIFRQAISTAAEEFSYFSDIFKENNLGGAPKILLKTLGISLAVETTSDICKDFGENSIASKIELFGKIELILISLPLIKKILDITKELIL